jgi:hypothetical protein
MKGEITITRDETNDIIQKHLNVLLSSGNCRITQIRLYDYSDHEAIRVNFTDEPEEKEESDA